VRFGVALPNYGPLQGREPLIRMCRAAEELGYDALWANDHVVAPVGAARRSARDRAIRPARLLPIADPLVSLAVAAGCTERVGLGTSVLVLPLRNPLLTAKMLASLDVLSGGRVTLGAGAGWLSEEFEALDAPDFGARGQVVEEWIAIFRACWTEDQPSHDGRHYRFAPIECRPQPASPIPVLVGGSSPPALRRAARIGDGWLGSALPEAEVAAAVRTVREEAERHGRDPGALTFGCGYTVDLDDGPDDPVSLTGPPSRLVDRIGRLAQAGLDLLELRFAPVRDAERASLARTLELLEAFAAEVAPALR
jgi:probable F420-dependent oxidoreductase